MRVPSLIRCQTPSQITYANQDSPDGSSRLPTTVTLRAPQHNFDSKPAWQVVIRPLSG